MTTTSLKMGRGAGVEDGLAGQRDAFFHASPTRYRDSILANGLFATTWDTEANKPRRSPAFAIPGQTDALYLVRSPDDAWEYVRHYWSRFHPRGDFGLMDLWELTLPEEAVLLLDEDWHWTEALYTTTDVPPALLRLADTWVYESRFTYTGPPSNFPLAKMLAERSS